MQIHKAHACALAVVLLIGIPARSATAQAAAPAPATVSIGAVEVAVPTHAALSNLSSDGRVWNWASGFMEPSSRLLAVFVSKEEPGLADLAIKRYAVVKTPKSFEQRVVTPLQFQDLKRVLRQSAERLATLAERANDQLPSQAGTFSRAIEARMENMEIGTPLLVEVQRDDDVSYGYTYIVKMKAEIDGRATAWRTASCNATMLVRGKRLIINTYTAYSGNDDLRWLGTTCRELTDAILADNRQ
jgi:hypothetical protein